MILCRARTLKKCFMCLSIHSIFDIQKKSKSNIGTETYMNPSVALQTLLHVVNIRKSSLSDGNVIKISRSPVAS